MPSIKQKIENLRNQIREHDHLYYTLDRPKITDFDYDKLYSQLLKLEQENPELITPDSPTQRVGGEPLEQFEKLEHRIPMLSLSNSYSPEDLIEFNERVKKFLKADQAPEYFCEPKLDGLAIEVIYERGLLTTALTRGDGLVGENVTSNVKTIRSIPLKLHTDNPPDLLEVRGEIVMLKSDFKSLNENNEELGLQVFANPRNAAAGTLRQLDPRVTATRPLKMYSYAIGAVDGIEFESQHELEKALHNLGLPTLGLITSDLKQEIKTQKSEAKKLKANEYFHPPLGTTCKTIDDVVSYYHYIEDLRHSLPYDIDGIVVKVNRFDLQEELGFIARSPRWASAAKYKPEQATTVIKEISVQVGRTGALTPVAIMEPVKVGGVKITNATLHNQDEIDRKDVRVGDTVIVQRAGDVIPEVVTSIKDKRPKNSKPFKMPTKCPECSERVEQAEGEAKSRCVNAFCPAIVKESLKHFVSRRAMNIDKLGEKILEQLNDKGLVNSFSDLYKLTKDDLLTLERQGDKSSQNIIDSIEKSKSTKLGRFIYSLGIRHVGEQTAQTLASEFKTLESFLQSSLDKLVEINDVGPVVAESIVQSLKNKTFVAEVKELLKSGINIEELKTKNSGPKPLDGLNIVVTGTLPMGRNEIKDLIKDLGGKSAGSVSKNTDYVLAGESAGSKLEKAESLGVKVLDWDAFQTLIK